MLKFNAIILKLLREANGLTQEELCAKHGINQALWSKWERGLALPTEAMIGKIADEIFRYPRDYLLQPMYEIPTGLVYHRKRTALKSSDRAKIEARARLLAFDAVKVCECRGVRSRILCRSGRSAVTAARELRKLWSVGDGAITNLVELLEENGIVVIAFDFRTDLIDGFYLPVKADHECICIALNTNSAFTTDRQRFTLAHELGHAVLHRSEFVELKTAEREANDFASEFLLPEKDVRTDLSVPLTFTNLKNLKIKWRVSMSALAHRALEIGVATDAVYRRTCVFLASCGYRKHEPDMGIDREEPQLVKRLLNELVDQGVDVNELLLLSEKRCKSRYCLPNTEGGRMDQ